MTRSIETTPLFPLDGWARLFVYGALLHLFVASVWTTLFIVPGLDVSRIVAGGSSGNWFTVGYLMYILAGPLGMLAFSILYRMSRRENSKVLGWLHLVAANVGIMGACFLLGYAGYHGGYMEHVVPVLNPGTGPNIPAIHEFLITFVTPIGIFVLVAVLGTLVGTINIALSLREKKQAHSIS